MHLNPINHPQYGPFNLSLPPSPLSDPPSHSLQNSGFLSARVVLLRASQPSAYSISSRTPLYSIIDRPLSLSLSDLLPRPDPALIAFFCLCMSRHSVFLFLCFIVELTDSAYSLSYRYLTYPHPRFINRAYGLKMFSFYEFCLQFVTTKGTVMR